MPDLRWLLPLAFLVGCANPQSGGGTDLPSPIRIFVQAPPTSSGDPAARQPAIRQGHLWSVEESTADSATLLSQGILFDSAGVLFLPPDAGTYLVEAWEKPVSIQNLPLRQRVSWRSISLDTAQYPINTFGSTSGGAINKVMFSESRNLKLNNMDTGLALADFRSILRISGTPRHSTRIIRGADTMVQAEAFLWSLEGDSLTFRGAMGAPSGSFGWLPTPIPGVRYVLEGWSRSNLAPSTVVLRRHAPDLTSAWNNGCAIHISRLGTFLATLYACETMPESLQKDSAFFWVPFDYDP